MNDFEEEYMPVERKRSKTALWVSLIACAVIACTVAAASIFNAAPLYPMVPQPTTEPTPSAQAVETTPDVTPEITPCVTESTPAAEQEAFVDTAIVIDGECIGVLASKEAAEEALDEAVYAFELKINLPGSMDSYIQNEVELVAAAELDDAATAEVMTYETMLELLSGENTPLKVITTLSEKRTDIIAHETKTEKDASLIKGTRLVKTYGTDGESRTVTTTEYINGVQQGKSKTETFEISLRVDAVIAEGSIKADNHTEPGKREGVKGPSAEGLSFIRPTKSGKISQNFGQLNGILHLGLDLEADEGDNVLASEAGTVVSVMERGGYGLVVEIQHEGGFLTRYAHLKESLVSLGDTVAQGDVIALAGSSGNADKAHLHFELRCNGTAYNPRFYLK